MCLNHKHLTYTIKQILTYDVGQYEFYRSSTTILTLALPRLILLPQIHKTPYCPQYRSIFVYYLCTHTNSIYWLSISLKKN